MCVEKCQKINPYLYKFTCKYIDDGITFDINIQNIETTSKKAFLLKTKVLNKIYSEICICR